MHPSGTATWAGGSMGEALSAMESALGGARPARDPFPHFILPHLFDAATADYALGWLKRDAPWIVESRGFYLHHGCTHLARFVAGTPAEVVAAPETFQLLRRHLERAFSVKLSDRRFDLAAHRMLPGHRIRVHTDCPRHGTETHRFLVNLNSRFDDEQGGHLILLDMNAPEQSAVIVRPLHNSAVAMEFSERSWHCVDEILAGERYSLVYSFWTEEAAARADAEASPEGEAAGASAISHEEFQSLVALLRAEGANAVPHTTRYLIDHLQGTYRILQRWGCDADICKAGLFHSVLGTPGFPRPLVGDERVDVLRDAVGDRALLLVRLFSRTDWSSLRDLLSGAALSDGGAAVTLSHRDKSALAVLTWANVLEQSAYVRHAGETVARLRELFGHTAGILPPPAGEEIREMLAAY